MGEGWEELWRGGRDEICGGGGGGAAVRRGKARTVGCSWLYRWETFPSNESWNFGI